ncbi:MAG: cation diffusion facilitator family transporter [Actinomycetes bacterium]|jgi:cation diffusion facilitator family transporter|nr:cation diffusion facilitator family transporter [Actinomycetes bacterium]
MTRHDTRIRTIRLAAVVALVGNLFLAVLKVAFGAIAGSAALIGDGIDSSADVLISLITLVVVRIIERPPDKDHPWGHGRAETIAVTALSFVLFFAGAQLIFRSVANLFSGVVPEIPGRLALVATVVSIVGKILLALSQYVLGRRAESAMVTANAKNMAGDVLISLGVLAGLVLSFWTGSGRADVIIAVLVGVWVIKTAIGIFRDANSELMDGGAGTAQYQAIFDAVNSVPGAGNPHRTRIRRIGGFWDIDTDIEVDPDLTVQDAHVIASRVEDAIKQRLDNVFDIVIHVEPHNDPAAEGYGLSEKEL